MLQVALCSVSAIFVGGVASVLGWVPLAAGLHLGVAAGALPLIFAAMLHFVPVLTRTGRPHRGMMFLPWGGMVLGWGVFFYFQSHWQQGVLGALAMAMLCLVCCLSGWIIHRMRTCLGRAHIGVKWYLFALSALMTGLIMVIGMDFVPERYWAARNFHLHVNLLGFIGGAALGTLPVLMPTALKVQDLFAARWLFRTLPVWSIAVFCVAVGAMEKPYRMLADLGGALMGIATLILILHWLKTFHSALLTQNHGAARALLVATVGFALLLMTGITVKAHGFELVPLYLQAFLFPLVSGALSQLLPVWCWPGAGQESRKRMYDILSRWRGSSALLSFMAGFLRLAGFDRLAFALLLMAVAFFVFSLLRALLFAAPVLRSTR